LVIGVIAAPAVAVTIAVVIVPGATARATMAWIVIARDFARAAIIARRDVLAGNLGDPTAGALIVAGRGRGRFAGGRRGLARRQAVGEVKLRRGG
jgi:hypothetical protein